MVLSDDEFAADDFYLSDDSDSDPIISEHDLQARLENKGIDISMDSDSSSEEQLSEDDNSNDSSSDNESNTQSSSNIGLGKSFGDVFTKLTSKDNNNGPLSKYKAPITRLEKEKLDYKIRSVIRSRKRQKLEKNHILPDQYSSFNEEKQLKYAARKGVVKLFNAVNKHQKILAKEITEAKITNPDKVEKLSKEKFFEILQQTNDNSNTMAKEKQLNNNKDNKTKNTTWSIFDDNYMLHNQKLRDWDKKTEEDLQMEKEYEGEGIGFDDW